MKRIALKFVLSLVIGFMIVDISSAQVVPVPPVKSKTLPATSVPAPVDLTVTHEKESITVSWRDRSNGRAACRIERKTGKDGAYQEIATVDAGVSSYRDKVQAGKSYSYRVRAYIGLDKDIRYSVYSNEASVSIPATMVLHPDATRPAAKISSPPKVLTIPAVINVPGTLTVTGGKPPAAPTAVLTIPAVVDVQGTMTVTGAKPAAAPTAVLTIPVVINVNTTLTVSGQSQ